MASPNDVREDVAPDEDATGSTRPAGHRDAPADREPSQLDMPARRRPSVQDGIDRLFEIFKKGRRF